MIVLNKKPLRCEAAGCYYCFCLNKDYFSLLGQF